ncbi:MAG: hypothetical protein IT422_10680 [Pirellulaceae bacterium]|jgi:hypothetical protein|nr:hypothetical protein [Pirellulaceae bacterium]
MDDIIEVYKKDIDRSLLRENLKLTPQQRSERFEVAMRLIFELRRAAELRRTTKRLLEAESASKQREA